MRCALLCPIAGDDGNPNNNPASLFRRNFLGPTVNLGQLISKENLQTILR